MTKTIPVRRMIEIQEMQFQLDKLKKERMNLNSEIKSLQIKIPNLIRSLELR